MNADISRAKAILEKIRYAAIATASKNGKPWNSPVAHEYDKDLNIYWFSDKNNQHSKNVRENPEVFRDYRVDLPLGQLQEELKND